MHQGVPAPRLNQAWQVVQLELEGVSHGVGIPTVVIAIAVSRARGHNSNGGNQLLFIARNVDNFFSSYCGVSQFLCSLLHQ